MHSDCNGRTAWVSSDSTDQLKSAQNRFSLGLIVWSDTGVGSVRPFTYLIEGAALANVAAPKQTPKVQRNESHHPAMARHSQGEVCESGGA